MSMSGENSHFGDSQMRELGHRAMERADGREPAAVEDFNALLLFLLKCPDTNNYEKKVHALQKISYRLICEKYAFKERLRYSVESRKECALESEAELLETKQAFVWESIHDAWLYFMNNYLPGSGGEAPKIKIEKPGSAFNWVLYRKFQNTLTDHFRREQWPIENRTRIQEEQNRNAGAERLQPREIDRRGGIGTEIVLRGQAGTSLVREEEARIIKEAVSQALNTIPGRIGKAVFSADVKRAAKKSYIDHVCHKEMTPREWRDKYLHSFMSEPDKHGQCSPMDWIAFNQYFNARLQKMRDELERSCRGLTAMEVMGYGLRRLGKSKQ